MSISWSCRQGASSLKHGMVLGFLAVCGIVGLVTFGGEAQYLYCAHQAGNLNPDSEKSYVHVAHMVGDDGPTPHSNCPWGDLLAAIDKRDGQHLTLHSSLGDVMALIGPNAPDGSDAAFLFGGYLLSTTAQRQKVLDMPIGPYTSAQGLDLVNAQLKICAAYFSKTYPGMHVSHAHSISCQLMLVSLVSEAEGNLTGGFF